MSALRYIPAAMTPLALSEVGRAALLQFKGEPLREFEQAICGYVGLSHGYTFTSFMRAIYACLIAMHQNRERNPNKRHVVLSRYSCPSFVHAIHAAGLSPLYCDVVPETLSMDLNALEQLNFDTVLCVIGVNFFGLTNPADKIAKICTQHDVFFLEGLDYSLGTKFKGVKVGNFGDFSVLNFQEGKTIPVSGGMILTNRPEVMDPLFGAKRKKRTANIALMCGYSIVTRPLPYSLFMHFSQAVGKNIRKRLSMEDTIRNTSSEFDFSFDKNSPLEELSNFQAVLATELVNRYEEHIEARGQNANILKEGLAGIPGIQLIIPEHGVTRIHYVRFPILVPALHRARLVEELAQAGIEGSTMYSDHGINVEQSEFPGATRVMNELLTLPCHPGLEQRDLERTISVIKLFAKENLN